MTNTLETGGSERQFATVARELKPDPLQIRLGCLNKKGPFAGELGEIAEFPLEGSLFNRQSQRARIALGRYLRAHRVMVAHSFDFYSNFMLIPSARLAGVPVVIGSQRQIGDLLTNFRNTAQNALFRWCDRVTCNSRAAARGLERAGVDREKLAVIPNALPEAAFAKVEPALSAKPDVIRVGMLARMNDASKRHDVFLKAAAQVAGRETRVEFVVVGDGALRAGFEKMAADLGLANRVLFLGERRDVPAVLASCDISVLSSDSESLSNAIMESMAAGLPVIACRVGGNEELIRDGESGFLVEAGSDEQMADRIVTLVREAGLRKAFGSRARTLASSFSAERVCGEYAELYRSLLQGKGIALQALAGSVS